MLSRAPEFMFSPADVEAIMRQTDLNKAQVQVWAENFRMRYGTEKERMDFLKADGGDKVRDHPSSLESGIFSTPELSMRVT
jgi:hypothetical protein